MVTTALLFFFGEKLNLANEKFGNSIYVDSTGELTTQKTHVHQVIVTATSANAIVVLVNNADDEKVCDLRVATSGDTKPFLFEVPLIFPNGVKVLTLTGAIVTIVYNVR